MAWSIRGASRPDFLSQVKKLSRKFAPSILFLSKKKVNVSRSLDILPKLQFDSFDFVNPIGFSGGLWLCWNSSAISLNIVLKNNTMMHCVVYLAHLNINCSISFLYRYPQHHKQKEI